MQNGRWNVVVCLRRQRRRCRILVDRGHSAAAATTALFADLSGAFVDFINDVFQLIERFYRYVIRHRSTATFFVALNADGQAEGEPCATFSNSPRHYPIFIRLSVSSHFTAIRAPSFRSCPGGNMSDTGGCSTREARLQ
jgi:hypothetical protein